MTALPSKIIEQAQKYRKDGWSHRDITSRLGISLGSAFKYTQHIKLTRRQHLTLKWRNIPKPTYEQMRAGGLKATHKFKPQYSGEDLTRSIQNFFQQHGRIPLKREVTSHKPYVRLFGSWNAAIKAAGYRTNPVKYARKHYTKDGHKCDSFSEFVIDNWLSQHNIPHKIHIRYPETLLTSDFLVEDIYIEFVGLEGKNMKYDQYLAKKRRFIRNHRLHVIEVKPADLFPKNKLASVLVPILS